ncbi:MAG: DNA polymerase III subunit delta' [Paludibacterium sp.]|uniref:DNA polymerase III subunit delta' n=1 Tax=Paludibacterium sp. TaxID=1917523 RepID=UPI0025DFDA8E|nr:DNA polymerase III subunit delta' [Paludibacterium sp.]MBV8049035.1 DNA polymerase III subunit delta' [Paludibacterium sp.]MBV8646066.1 DNA polymerase III subunit delta' [Paludibacterium sp.]
MRYPWQKADWQRINRERDRLPNAWLLTGLAGIGKSAFAEELARSLLCDRPGPDHAACGECESCRWFALGSHPDYRRLSPVEAEDEDKAGRKLPVIKIEAVREMIEFAHLTSHRHGQRVVLVEPAEALNPAAGNALLKILEEPPADVLFLLVAHAPQRLLPTIRSRCRQFAMTAPAADEALAWLHGQGVADPATELAHHGGAPLFDHDPTLAAARKAFVEGLIQPTLANVLLMSERADKLKLALAVPLEWLQMWLFDLSSMRLSGTLRYYPDHRVALDNLARRADLTQLMQAAGALDKLAPYGQHTLNVRLQLESALMEYLKIFA